MESNLNPFGLGVTLGLTQEIVRIFSSPSEKLGTNIVELKAIYAIPASIAKQEVNLIVIQGCLTEKPTEEEIDIAVDLIKNLHWNAEVISYSNKPVGTALVQNRHDEEDRFLVDLYGFNFAFRLPSYLDDEESFNHMVEPMGGINIFEKLIEALKLDASIQQLLNFNRLNQN